MNRLSQPCRTCNGDCRMVHPHWQQYHAQIGVYTIADFFLNLGYLPNENLPPVMVACPTCSGVGQVPAPVPVATNTGLLHQLGMWLYKWLGGVPL